MPGFRQYRYPLHESNQFDLLVDGQQYFPAMLAAIEAAKSFILLEQYLVSSGEITHQFIQKLIEAAQRGISIYVMLDDFGSSGFNETDRQRLHDNNIQLHLFNPFRFKQIFNSLFRNHRKILVVDGQVAFVGGAGLADEFSEQQYGQQAWHDVMLKIRGDVVKDWCNLFCTTWEKHAKPQIEITIPESSLNVGNQSGRVLTATPLRRQEINRALIKHIRRSETCAWITSPYFVTTRKIRRVLRQAAWRGVDVRLLLPGQYSDHPWISFATRRHYSRLLKSGVRIFEYQPRFIHAKIELCDDWVSLGSSNLDRWNQRWNLDANQAVYDAELAEQSRKLFEQDFSDCIEITLAMWRQRPWLSRFRELISGQIVVWLETIIRSRNK
ncbi:MAG: phosphatidylserine/phosphatidylglycerophosphate/cardiolipin synthase family protein [Gammaproteobacteria bacterium]|nr:phosphatidylserine/phosphatidylglycerophosphate/cardiolipin synthase family protein [Gammaproteobacteria bacterium]